MKAHRLFVSLSLRLKDLLGPVTRVKKNLELGGGEHEERLGEGLLVSALR